MPSHEARHPADSPPGRSRLNGVLQAGGHPSHPDPTEQQQQATTGQQLQIEARERQRAAVRGRGTRIGRVATGNGTGNLAAGAAVGANGRVVRKPAGASASATTITIVLRIILDFTKYSLVSLQRPAMSPQVL